jgi:hypothetical protein
MEKGDLGLTLVVILSFAIFAGFLAFAFGEYDPTHSSSNPNEETWLDKVKESIVYIFEALEAWITFPFTISILVIFFFGSMAMWLSKSWHFSLITMLIATVLFSFLGYLPWQIIVLMFILIGIIIYLSMLGGYKVELPEVVKKVRK